MWGAKHVSDRAHREEKGHINPCQCRPNYLSPWANKRRTGQLVGRGREGGVWGPARAASDAIVWPPSLLLLSGCSGPFSSLLLCTGPALETAHIQPSNEEFCCLHLMLVWHFHLSCSSPKLCFNDKAFWSTNSTVGALACMKISKENKLQKGTIIGPCLLLPSAGADVELWGHFR